MEAVCINCSVRSLLAFMFCHQHCDHERSIDYAMRDMARKGDDGGTVKIKADKRGKI